MKSKTDTEQFSAIKKLLEKKEKQYLELLTKIKKYPDYGSAEEDNILEMEEFEESLGLRKNVQKGLKETRRALKMIAKGHYGTCSSCKHPINPERLKIYPTAALCVKCKSEQAKRRARWFRLPWRR